MDLACGGGRHSRLLLAAGFQVTALDRDLTALSPLADHPGVTAVEADLEAGGRFPLAGRTFDLVVVTNYLHRPLFGDLRAAVAPGGGLIYETFAVGNEVFGRPRNPNFLLRPGELRTEFDMGFEIIAFEDVTLRSPRPAVVQRLVARRWPYPLTTRRGSACIFCRSRRDRGYCAAPFPRSTDWLDRSQRPLGRRAGWRTTASQPLVP